MSLFDRTFLITAGVTAVICGAIYYFLNAKIRDLELALVKQNQVLSSFIANVQQEFRAMAMANGTGTSANNMTFEIIRSSNELASPEALAAVAGIDNRKIFITDSDSESETDASETDASETDASETDARESDSEADTNEADTNDADTNDADTSEADTTHNKLLICDLSLNDSKIIDMSSLDISHLEIYMSEKPGKGAGASRAGASRAGAGASRADADASSSESDEEDSDEEDNSEEDGFHRVSNLGIEQDNLTILKLLNIEDLTTVSDTNKLEETKIESLPIQTPAEPLSENAQTSSNPAPVSKYEDLKVDELRKLAVEKDLVKKDEVKKLKKPELLALLKTLSL